MGYLTDVDLRTLDQSLFFVPGPWCLGRSTAICLNNERFQIQVEWRDFRGNEGPGRIVLLDPGDSGLVKEYFNPLGNAADAITDTAAFATCN